MTITTKDSAKVYNSFLRSTPFVFGFLERGGPGVGQEGDHRSNGVAEGWGAGWGAGWP